MFDVDKTIEQAESDIRKEMAKAESMYTDEKKLFSHMIQFIGRSYEKAKFENYMPIEVNNGR